MMTIGKRIKRIRDDFGFSQKELAELTGINDEIIAMIEDDNYKKFSFFQLIMIAKALKVDYHYLLDKESEIEKPTILWCTPGKDGI